jgi:hypothetical protein
MAQPEGLCGMAGRGKDDALDGVVVVMFENRSLNDRFGRLRQRMRWSRSMVTGYTLSNPIR